MSNLRTTSFSLTLAVELRVGSSPSEHIFLQGRDGHTLHAERLAVKVFSQTQSSFRNREVDMCNSSQHDDWQVRRSSYKTKLQASRLLDVKRRNRKECGESAFDGRSGTV